MNKNLPDAQTVKGCLVVRSEFRTIQALRAVACFLVVAYHAIDAWGRGSHPPRTADLVWGNGAAGVDLFFVISGFVMAVSSNRLAGAAAAQHFIGRRLRRVVPLYWSMTLAKLAVLAALGTASLPGVWQVLASLMFLPVRDTAGVVRPVLGVGWTLQFEMLFYAIFAAVIWRRPRGSAWHMLLALFIPLALAGFFRRADWPAPLFLANGLVLEFCLGVALAQYMAAHPISPRRGAIAAAAGLVLLLVLPEPGPWRFAAWGGPAALTVAGAVAMEPWSGRLLPGWVIVAGNASYATYLVHPFLVPVLAAWLPGYAPAGTVLPVLVLASLLLSSAAGPLLHRHVDLRLQRWVRAAGQPRRAEAAPASPLGAV